MAGVPGASINGVNLEKIRKKNVKDADEIKRLGQRINSLDFSDDDYLRLCTLLLQYDECYKAKGLLFANCVPGDSLHELFQREFPECQWEFDLAVKHFILQFNCELALKENLRFLNAIYECNATAASNQNDDCVARLLHTAEDTEVQIEYDLDRGAMAHFHAVEDPNTIRLVFDGTTWIKDN
jgi:hypothetical protein